MLKANRFRLEKENCGCSQNRSWTHKVITGFLTQPRTGVRSIIKKFKESHATPNMPGRGKKQKISKTLQRTTAETLMNDLAKSGILVLKKSVEPFTGMDCRVVDQEKLYFCKRDALKPN